jgi:ionotropic glutamate receptor
MTSQVFPKRSPLIPDISHAVLSVTEGQKILDLENKWFKKDGNCEDLSIPKVSSYSLGLESFWGLFLIAGVASILALIIFVASFTYRHRHILVNPDSRVSTWGRIRAMFKIFNEKDLDCHTFKSSSPPHDSAKASPNNFPESPFSYT